MNKNFNLVKILKNAPKGTKLWSPICGECELISVRDTNTYPILCKSSEGHDINFTEFGKYYGVLFKNGECVLFPSKENRDWSTFRVPNKSFKPFQKVLIRSEITGMWEPDIYRFYDSDCNVHRCMCNIAFNKDILPYEGNEDKFCKPIK